MTILDYQVSASSDDADQLGVADGYICRPDNSALGYLAGLDTTDIWNGFRFTGVTIPNGATITAAYLSFYLPNAAWDEPDVLIYAHNSSTAGTFQNNFNNISNRTRTTASVGWSSTGLGSSAGWYSTPSIVSIIEELMASYSYAAGVAMVFVMTTRAGNAVRDLVIQSYDLSGDTTKAAKLHIEYTSGGGASAVPVIMDHLRQQGIS